LENKLRKHGVNISIQGELIGESVQGNLYKLKGQTVKFFNLFDIDSQEYYSLESFKKTLKELALTTVPILETSFKLPETINELLLMANGKSELNSNLDREGLVIRSFDRKISFKVISNNFLLNHE
jgi:hypothetical protein